MSLLEGAVSTVIVSQPRAKTMAERERFGTACFGSSTWIRED